METYYWDTYWIIEGLLVSGMRDTAKGMVENMIGTNRVLLVGCSSIIVELRMT